MKILISNLAKVGAALDEAQKRASVRTVTVDDIMNILDNIKVPKSRLDGTVVYWDGGEQFPSCYGYQWKAESTHWRCENHKGKWYLTYVGRDHCPNRRDSGYISYSQSAKEWLLKEASRL